MSALPKRHHIEKVEGEMQPFFFSFLWLCLSCHFIFFLKINTPLASSFKSILLQAYHATLFSTLGLLFFFFGCCCFGGFSHRFALFFLNFFSFLLTPHRSFGNRRENSSSNLATPTQSSNHYLLKPNGGEMMVAKWRRSLLVEGLMGQFMCRA